MRKEMCSLHKQCELQVMSVFCFNVEPQMYTLQTLVNIDSTTTNTLI